MNCCGLRDGRRGLPLRIYMMVKGYRSGSALCSVQGGELRAYYSWRLQPLRIRRRCHLEPVRSLNSAVVLPGAGPG